ncbi:MULTISPECIES: acyl-CoA synthetase [unclassified Paludibacterium]|uniref:LpxL/LpxP family acyltransferase n=1 Tax=unclassified Paludibacterium TaxID=2618429 RepID=UPI001C03E63F|nr:acyl-CoA synthetase [Paludibacterium sp. B53371]BEV73825.1 acyltransferase [Paludibacterium sp. THUN1379]
MPRLAVKDTPAWMQRKERGSALLLGFMSQLSLRLGRAVSRLVLFGIAAYFTLFGGKAGRASRQYLTRSLGRPPRWHERYRHVLAFATTIHDRVYLLRDRFDQFDIELVGAEALHQHCASGQGLLLFGAHLGSFEVLRSMARQRPDMRVSMAMYPENARQIQQTLAAINPGAVQDIIPLGSLDAMLRVHERLKQGALVGLLADRATGPDTYVPHPFLGTPAPFPGGPFRMAAMLGHPVYFIAGLYLGGNRYQLHFERLDDPSAAAGQPRDALASDLMARYVAVLARHCQAQPFNWFNFYDFWNEA